MRTPDLVMLMVELKIFPYTQAYTYVRTCTLNIFLWLFRPEIIYVMCETTDGFSSNLNSLCLLIGMHKSQAVYPRR